jgi:hypothetical protein
MPGQNSSISNFKQFLLRILLPLMLLLSVGGWVCDVLFTRKMILNSELCGAYKVNRIINETYKDEIPIFGSSRAEYGLIPDSLGGHIFNYGLAGTGYDVTLFFVERECSKKKRTPIIINLDLDGITAHTGDISNYIPNCTAPDIHTLLGDDDRAYFKIPFIRYFGRYENYMRLYLSNRIELTKFNNKGASLERNVLPASEFAALVKERQSTTTTFTIDTALSRRLFKVIAEHPERTFVFVIAPYHASYFANYSNMDVAYTLMASLKGHPNVRVFDDSHLALADSCFLNTTHINYKGALIYNTAIRDSLQLSVLK